ncbi:hypothetical protein [Vibrio sp. TRT 17S01]|uniref:hypothetical protein n=1 Tax=Vibrio sp. TRT 17S01 TaxID=3418505 RepID=UPI003CF4A1FA
MNLVELLDRPIAFHRPFVELGLGITGALFLSQALYWSRRTNSSGYFYKTQEEWEAETGMTRREQETARKKLKSFGILEEKKQGVPCRVFYRINDQKLLSILSQKESENQETPVCTEAPNQFGGMRQTSMAETDTLDCTNPPSSDGGNSQTKTEITQRLPETTSKEGGQSRKKFLSFVGEENFEKNLNASAWLEWLGYRKTILKKPYKSERSERAAMTKLISLSGNNHAMQEKIVSQSIDNDWTGLFELKSATYGQSRSSAGTTAQVGESYRDGMDVSAYQLPQSKGDS